MDNASKTFNAQTATTKDLVNMMNRGYTRSEIAAATAEYWRRVECGDHTPPAAVELVGPQDTDEEWHRAQMAKLHAM